MRESVAAVATVFANPAALQVRREGGAGVGKGRRHRQAFAGLKAEAAVLQPLALEPTAASEGLVLTASRTLYTSWESATVHSPEADKLHREEFVEMNAADAAALGVEDDQEVVLANDSGELTIRVKISGSVLPGSVFVPLYYDGGAVTALFGHEDGALARVRIAVRARA